MKKMRLPFYERMFFAYYALNKAIKSDIFGGTNWFYSVNMLTATILLNAVVLARYLQVPVITSSHAMDAFIAGSAIYAFNWAFFFNRKRFVSLARAYKTRQRRTNIIWIVAVVIYVAVSIYLFLTSP